MPLNDIDSNEVHRNKISLVGDSFQHISHILALNNSGVSSIIAPNHLSPESKIRHQFAIADDFPEMKEIMQLCGIQHIRPVARGDTDMAIGNSLIALTLYKTHTRFWSALGGVFANSLPININRDAPVAAAEHNIKNIRNILRVLQSEKEVTNIAIYPYGNWFDSGKQVYADTDIPEPNKKHQYLTPSDPGYEEQRNGLKRGAFALSRISNRPLFPVHIQRHNGITYVAVGECINPQTDNTEEEITNPQKYDAAKTREAEYSMQKQYLESMRLLKQQTEREIENSAPSYKTK